MSAPPPGMTVDGQMIDPQLAAWDAEDPEHFLDRTDPEPLPLRTRHDVARDITIALIVMAALVARELMSRRIDEQDDIGEVARGAWRKHLPTWFKLVGPAVQQAYELGQVDGLSSYELELLAHVYAEQLGDYVNQSSADALSQGLYQQLNQKWSYGLAKRRAVAGYGLDGVSMRQYLTSAMKAAENVSDPIPAISRTLITKLLVRRAERVGREEAYTAEQSGKAMSWMYLYQQGRLPGAVREWELGGTEEHCGVCQFLRDQQVLPDEPFVMPDGSSIWAPRAHPGCGCRVRLATADGTIIAKADVNVAGLAVVAKDTGRVLMLQRALDGDDPAGGTWEFPGGHAEQDELLYGAAKREWEEEVHRRLPPVGRPLATWKHGIYQGFVVVVPSEDLVPTHKRGRVANPDDPDGDEIEAYAWWDVDHLARNPAVRPELRESLSLFRDAYDRSTRGISKAYGDDPYARDEHGHFASRESRRRTLEPVEMDSGLKAVLDSIRMPSLGSDTQTLGHDATSLGSSSLGALQSLGQRQTLGAPQSLGAKAAQQQAQQLRVTIRLPQLRPERKPGREPDPYYLPYADMIDAMDDYADGQSIDHMLNEYVVGQEVDFPSTNQYWRDKSEFGGLDDSFGDEDEIEGHQAGGPNVLIARRGLSSLKAMFSEDEYSFWSEFDPGEMRGLRDDISQNIDAAVGDLSDAQVNAIYRLAGYDTREGMASQRRRLVDSIQRPKAEHGLGDATLDYLTYVVPSSSGTPYGERLEHEMRQEIDIDSPPVQQIFVFDQGFHRHDVEMDRGMAIDHSYEVTDVTYQSSLGEEAGESPAVAGYRLVHVRPIED